MVQFGETVCGDSLNLLDQLSDDSVHLTLTDIPYNVVNRSSGGLRNLDKGQADVGNFDLDVLVEKLVTACIPFGLHRFPLTSSP